MKTIHFLFLAVLVALAVSATSQTLVDAQTQTGYATPADARTAALYANAYTPVTAVLPTTTIMPGYTGGQYTTYTVVRQAWSDECSEPSRDVVEPAFWTGIPVCETALGYPQTHAETDLPSALAWVTAHLDATQQKTCIVFRAPGAQRHDVAWWVVYQPYSYLCF